MKIKHLKKSAAVLLLGFIFIINTIPVSFAQGVPADTCPEGIDHVLLFKTADGYNVDEKGEFVKSICQKDAPIDNWVAADTCPSGTPYYENGESGEIVACGTDATQTEIYIGCYPSCPPGSTKSDCIKDGKIIPGEYHCSGIQQTDLSGLRAVVPAYVPRVEIPCNTKIAGGACPANWKTDLGSYVGRLYQFGLMIAGIIAFAVIIFGAAQYTLSAGGFASKEDAKDIMLNAIYGLLLLFGAYLVLYTINPNLVKLGNFQIEPINLSEFNPPEQIYISGDNNKVSESSGTAGIPGCLVAVSETGGLLGTGFQAGLTVTSDQGTQQYGTDTTKKMLCTKCTENYTLENGVCCLSIITKSCVSCAGLKDSIGAQLKSGFNKTQAEAILISDFGQNQGKVIMSKCGF